MLLPRLQPRATDMLLRMKEVGTVMVTSLPLCGVYYYVDGRRTGLPNTGRPGLPFVTYGLSVSCAYSADWCHVSPACLRDPALRLLAQQPLCRRPGLSPL